MSSRIKDLDYYAGKFTNLNNQIKKLKLENKELRKQLNLHVVSQRSEQYCDCDWNEEKKPIHLNTHLVCKHCEKYL